MSDTRVTLDDFTFQDFEVPEEMAGGVSQRLDTKQPPGGIKIVDATGAEDEPLRWSGSFMGPDAPTRAKLLAAKVRAGRLSTLTWGEFSFSGVLQEFSWRYRGRREIDYRATFEVITDESAPPPDATSLSVDEMVLTDMIAAADASQLVGDATLTGLMGTLTTAVDAVGSFATATRSVISTVLSPIAAVQDRVQDLIGQAEGVMMSVNAIGGVIPGLGNADLTSNLLGQLRAVQDSANLYDLDNILARMRVNLNAIGSSGAEVLTVGADLYAMATTAYGTPSEWVTIAAANGLSDPIVQGIQTLLIPPTPLKTGGVLTG